MTTRWMVSALVVAIGGSAALAQRTAEPVVHVKGFGGYTDPVGAQSFVATTAIEVLVTRFSTDAERDRFVAVGIPGLHKLPVIGQVTVKGNPPYDVYYAERTSMSGGTDAIELVTDRIAGVGRQKEAASYPVTVINIQLDSKGAGGGSLGGTAHISYTPSQKRIKSTDADPNYLLLHALHRVVPSEPTGMPGR